LKNAIRYEDPLIPGGGWSSVDGVDQVIGATRAADLLQVVLRWDKLDAALLH